VTNLAVHRANALEVTSIFEVIVDCRLVEQAMLTPRTTDSFAKVLRVNREARELAIVRR
jgi:hypothetical protein